MSRRTLLALLLGLATVGLAARAWHWRLPLSSAERLAATMGWHLLQLQGPDGAFDPYPDDERMPMIRRTGPHAMATYALARLARSPAGSVLPGVGQARDRALDLLVSRQQPGGMFGALPPGTKNPWPAVDTTSEAVLAMSEAGRPEDRGALVGAVAALVRAAEYGFRDGWTRALGVLALAAAETTGALSEAGGALDRLVVTAPVVDRVDCGDYALAEGIAQTARGQGEALRARILAACLERPPLWEGDRTDPAAWWLASRLARQTPGGEAWLGAVEEPLRQGAEEPPVGLIGQGWFSDSITQTACGILVLLEVAEARKPE